jgi:hypothetical protein
MEAFKFLLSTLLLPLLLVPITVVVVVDAALNGTCLAETAPLLNDTSLQVSQGVIFQDYNASYHESCNFGLTDFGCDISFDGDDRTYTALCESLGGQLYQRPVVLKCAFGAIKYDLGFIPTCVGASCNITDVVPDDVITNQVQSFLDNLTFTGCAAEGAGEGGGDSGGNSSAATTTTATSFTCGRGGLVQMAMLWVGVSALFGF